MKIKVTIETVLDLAKEDMTILKQAGAPEIIQTAQLQGAEVKIDFEKTKSKKEAE